MDRKRSLDGSTSQRRLSRSSKEQPTTEKVRAGNSSRLSPLLLQRPQAVQRQRLDGVVARLRPGVARGLERAHERLDALAKLYVSVDPERPLQRGFARVTRADGAIVRAGASLAAGEAVAIKFGDQVTRQAVIDGAASEAGPAPKLQKARPKPVPPPQGDLF